MPSAAAAASLPIPSPAPMTIMPSPIATPKKCRTPVMLVLRLVVSVMNVNGHADEHGGQQREDVRLNQDDDDLEPGHRGRQDHGAHEAHARAGQRSEQ